ncbi:DNA polymerase-4 [Jatrophihabitans endophyticus]|uniref:DNA polymerase IV n=1 Tax=Jatrophihabitans endophyticus TaxID=1206085 RepID=A0A1M5T178_9ACTN|nr:DNA polymerase IV [Jatrophihabitans endophyticus]SHH44113.1 DNA polymerase-4 [Jatrophihabitans endophyticus]
MILHADLDSFYASVEQRDEPSLRGRPVVVGGGVVLAASYEAKAFGVRSAMGGRQARLLCPHAIVVRPRFECYVEASRQVFAIFRDVTPLVEGISVDEAFLDVGGLGQVSGTPVEIAVGLRERVRDEVGLAITVGIARTKFLAKVASGVAKPDGLRLVPADGELAFLHPLPVQKLWGVGAVTTAKLHDRGLFTVGEVAALPLDVLVAMLGAGSGRHLHALAHNRDPRPVVVGRRRRSIGAQHALGSRRRLSLDEIDKTLVGLVDKTCRRLRKARRVCRTMVLRLRFEDFTRITRSHTTLRATWETAPLLATARTLLAAVEPLVHERGCTLIGVSLTNLDDADERQLELPFAAKDTSALDPVLDTLHERFGRDSVRRAALLGRSAGPDMPMLEQD